MTSHELKKKLPSLGMFILPIVLVKITSTILGGPGPVDAQAMISATPNAAVQVSPTQKWSDKQRQASSYVLQLRSEKFGQSPMLYDHVEEIAPIPVQVETGPAIPNFRMSAILASPNGNRAFINGELLRVGDFIGKTQYVVAEINPLKHSAVIKHSVTSATIVVEVEIPKAE